MLELEGLTRRFGDVVALDGLTITVPPGEVFGLLGPNGAGKTTAMRAVLGVSTPDAGQVLWRGKRVTLDDRLRFGYLPEERGLYPSMAVEDHLVYLATLHGLDRKAATSSAREWLDRLGVADRARSKVSALSLGNQQRVQLAAALVHAPDLLVLDEPFAGLDPVGVDTLAAVIDDFAARGATVVFSSHQLDLVESRCRSVAIVDRGRVVASGTVDALTTAGRRRLVVEVAHADPRRVFGGLDGVEISETAGNRARLRLADGADPQTVLQAAQDAGPVEHFSFERRRLSEVFREAVVR